MTRAFKTIKDIDCRVVRERDDQISILLAFPMEQLAQMFSDMLEEPIENVRGWLMREHTAMTLGDAHRLYSVISKAIEVAELIQTAQEYSVTVQDADCDCTEVWPADFPTEEEVSK